MATRYRGLQDDRTDRENLLTKNVKDMKVTARPGFQTRSAFGEVGNKLQGNGAHAKALLPSKEGKTKTAPEKENSTMNSKVDMVISFPNKTARRLDTLSLTNVKDLKSVDLDDAEEKMSYSNKQFDIIDPDAASKHDPLMAVEYLPEIFAYLRELEEQHPIRAKFLEGRHVTPHMRNILVNWLVEVHMNFKFCLETLHMCISLLDRYLQLDENVDRETLQLVGTSCMLIASKYEEMYIPDLSDFVYICDDVFSKRQILLMEIDILKKLNFNLGKPLSIHFLRRYSKVGQVKAEHHNMSKYILELALLSYEICHIRPSIQAAAACCLALAIVNEVHDASKVWTPTLVHYTTYKYSDFSSVIVSFAHLLKKADVMKSQAVRKKYASSAFAKISTSIKLKGPLVRKLAQTPT